LKRLSCVNQMLLALAICRRGLLKPLRWLCLLWVCAGLLATHSAAFGADPLSQPSPPPQRIVSLLPALTEAVCVLGACNRLVGVDRYSNWPAQVRQLPVLGGGLDPNIEAIVALKPDLVLTAASSPAAKRLKALGLNVLVLEPVTFADVLPMLQQVALHVGLPAAQAQSVWAGIESDLRRQAQRMPAHAHGLTVYVEVNPAPYAAGRASFIGEVMHLLGLQNIVPQALGPFPKLNPEFVVRANPSLIIVAQRESSGLVRRPGWSRIRAVAQQQVCELSNEQSDILVRPGPRIAEAAAILVACVQRTQP
jgi:iron complex transport system substrate-binding protein